VLVRVKPCQRPQKDDSEVNLSGQHQGEIHGAMAPTLTKRSNTIRGIIAGLCMPMMHSPFSTLEKRLSGC
jgi:hypothetical protein